ncbi:unnamed protein product [Prorocentrum cordatum]|uniref:Uncharacterized protein n=1 Tax=Prorocentrum cordatum TaxID=2364126 RepID=A0ABN9XAY9_9DINO|nr:unnamed protein product [Polarella glacialis]
MPQLFSIAVLQRIREATRSVRALLRVMEGRGTAQAFRHTLPDASDVARRQFRGAVLVLSRFRGPTSRGTEMDDGRSLLNAQVGGKRHCVEVEMLTVRAAVEFAIGAAACQRQCLARRVRGPGRACLQRPSTCARAAFSPRQLLRSRRRLPPFRQWRSVLARL